MGNNAKTAKVRATRTVKSKNEKPELLAPAGNWAMLAAAIKAGADSVYFGVKSLNMRANAGNFELSELKKAVEQCHEKKVKAYLTLNSIVYDNEIKQVEKILKSAKKAGIDAVIAWDLAVVSKAKELKIPFHISTQASISNSDALKFFKELGAQRAVLARENSLAQIKEMKKNVDGIEIECFCHGAMCVSLSGRCFTSQFIFNRSANRGDCLQPCRRRFKVTDIEEGYELELGNNYVMSAKDLCTLPFIDKMIKAGVNAFKIEGRNRDPEYVYSAVSAYRRAIDAVGKKGFNKELADNLVEELRGVYNRKFSSGFYLGLPTRTDFTDIYGSGAAKQKVFVGQVRKFYKKVNVADVKINAGGLKVGDMIFIQGNKTGHISMIIKSMELDHKKVSEAEKGQRVGVKVNEEVRSGDKVFAVRDK